MAIIEYVAPPIKDIQVRTNPSSAFIRRSLNKAKVKITDLSQKIASTITNVAASNTTTETTLFSFTIPANTMGSTAVLKVRMFVSMRGNSAAALSLRSKYGASTLVTALITPVNTGAHDGFWDFFMIGSTAADAVGGGVGNDKLHWNTLLLAPEQNVISNSALTYRRTVPVLVGGLDDSIDNVVSFTAQWDTATTDANFSILFGFAEIIKN